MFFNHHVVLVNANSDDVIFFSDDMGLVNVDLNNFSLDYDNFDIAYPETIIPVRLMASCNRYKQQKVRKKKKGKNNTRNMASNNMVGLVHVKR